MAGVITTTINDHLKQVEPHAVVDAVERKSALFNLFRKNFVNGGHSIRWKVNSAGNTSAQSYGEGDATQAAGNQTYVTPTLAWKYSSVVVRISRIALDEARDNYEIGTLIGDEMDKAVLDLAEDLEDQWMTDGTGNGSKDQTGIIIANDATGTYAGLARATYTFWASVEQAAIGTMALSDVQTVFQTLRNSTRRSKPDLVLCGPPVFDIMANLLDDRVTYMEPGSSLPNGLVLKHGVAAIHWRGAVWTEIPGYTTQRFDAVQSSDWHFDIVRNFAWDPVEIDGDDITTKMTVGMNLVCDHPGRQGHGIGITA